MKKEFLQTIKIIALGFVLAFGINLATAWTGPSSGPTSNNTEGPITVSSTRQIKLGGLNIGDSVSIAKDKAGDPYQFAKLDVNGATFTKGFVNLGMASIYPSNWNDSKTDGELFSVFSTKGGINEPDFVVDTRSSNRSTTTRNLNVNGDTRISGNAYFDGKSQAYLDFAARSNVYIGYGDQSSSAGKYTLDLDGTTNIGLGDICTLKKSDVVTKGRSCPDGTYLSIINPETTDTNKYGVCRSFSPRSSLTGKNCYDFPPLYLTVQSFTEELYNSSTGTNYCVPKVTVAVTTFGGDPGYTWDWSFKDEATNWQSQSLSSCQNKTSCNFYFKYNRSVYKGHGFDGMVTVNVKDSVGSTYTLNTMRYFPSSKNCY